MTKIIIEIPDRLASSFLGYMSDNGLGKAEFCNDFEEYEEGVLHFDYKDGGIQITVRDKETGEILEK